MERQSCGEWATVADTLYYNVIPVYIMKRRCINVEDMVMQQSEDQVV
jgi:hypothetical protein